MPQEKLRPRKAYKACEVFYCSRYMRFLSKVDVNVASARGVRRNVPFVTGNGSAFAWFPKTSCLCPASAVICFSA